MTRLTGWALRRPVVVLCVWLLVMVALAVNGTRLEDHIAPTSIEVPGTPSQDAQDLAEAEIGSRGQAPILLEGPAVEVQSQAARLTAALRRDPRNTVISAFDPHAPPQLKPRTGGAVILVERPTDESFGPAIYDAVKPVVDEAVADPVRASISGFSAIGASISEESVSNAHAAEMVALPILLLVLLAVFRSPLAAGLSMVLGGATVGAALGITDVVAQMRDVTDVATPLASMMGLALGVDYSLLMVSRFREARSRGQDVPEAAAIAAQTSGRTVVVAGTTIVATMGVALLLAPGTFLQSAAVGATAAAVVAVLGALTAVPAALMLVGRHLERWRIGPPPKQEGTRWEGLAAFVLRRPVVASVPAVAVLAVLAVPGIGVDAGPPDVRLLPSDTPARVDTERLVGALGPGWSAPLEAYAVDRDSRLDTPAGRRAVARLRTDLAQDPNVALVLGPRTLRRTTVVTVVPRSGPNDPGTAELYDRVTDRMRAFAQSTRTETAVGGVAAQLTDYRREFKERLPLLVLALSVVAFLALVLVLRALLLPLIAVLLNAMVVAASFGVLALVSTGSDPLLGGAGFADALSLLALLALVFGLSLDYQVFILSRMREAFLESGRIDEAIRGGLTRTGPVVVGAAVIMTGVFAAFMSVPMQTIRQTGAGLVATVLLAASAVCLVAIPAAMRLAGPATFWLPRWLDRLLPHLDLEGESGDRAASPFELDLGLERDPSGEVRGTLLLKPHLANGGGTAHGAVLPCVVDQLFAALVAERGRPVVTMAVTTTHRAPARAGRSLRLLASEAASDGPRRTVRATVHDGPLLVAEAEATLFELAPTPST